MPETTVSRCMHLNKHHDDFGRGLAQWHSMGSGGKPRLSFLGANGHAVTTYPFFLRRLAPAYEIEAMECRAAWPDAIDPVRKVNWWGLADDYAAFIKGRGMDDGSLVHVGHSLGGSLGLLTALRHPHWFKALVVIEPGSSFSRWARLLLKLLPLRTIIQNSKLIRSTLSRQFEFDSRSAFLESMRSKGTYRDFTEEAFNDYAAGGLVQHGNRYHLKYSGKWEGYVFCDAPYIWQYLFHVQVPTLVIRAQNTQLQSRQAFLDLKQRSERKNPLVSFIELPNLGHMVVQEAPDLVGETVLQWLAQQT